MINPSVIAVIDDDASVREAAKALLRSAGYQVGTFDSPDLFLGSAALNHTDCLIVDVSMPGMDGLELQRRLSALSSKIPIIFITAHDEGGRRYKALAGGAMDFLRKPFEADALLSSVRAALRRGAASA